VRAPGYAGADAGPILDTDNPYNNFAGYAQLDWVISRAVRLSAGSRVDYFTQPEVQLRRRAESASCLDHQAI